MLGLVARHDDPQVNHAEKLPCPSVLTDYHVHLRPDDLDASAEEYFTEANVERYLEAAREAGVGELGVSEHVYRFTEALELWDHAFWRAERGRRPRRLLRVRALDAAAARDRDGLPPRPRGPDRRPAGPPRARLRDRLGPLHRRRRGRPRRLRHLGDRRERRSRLGALLRHPRRGRALRPLRRPRPSRPGQGLGPGRARRPSATRASTTSPRSRRSPRPGSRSRSRRPGCESRSASSIRRTRSPAMCVDAGAVFSLSSDAHVPEHVGYGYERGGRDDARVGGRADRRVRAPAA